MHNYIFKKLHIEGAISDLIFLDTLYLFITWEETI